MTLRKKALVSVLVTLFMFAMQVPMVSAEIADNLVFRSWNVNYLVSGQLANYAAQDNVIAQQPEQQTTQTEQPQENLNVQQPEQQTTQTEQPQENLNEQQPGANNQAQTPTNSSQTVGTNVSNSEFQNLVVELVNQERAKVGLNPVVAKDDLTNVAQVKAEDMATNNYFSHTSPTYGSPFDMMKQFGINYSHAGENIAVGYSSPEQVMEGWMNSEGHKKNILNPNFTEIGVGFTTNGYYWVQEFAKR